MGFGEITIRKVLNTGLIALMCLAFLIGCNFPQPAISTSPGSTVLPDTLTELPPSPDVTPTAIASNPVYPLPSQVTVPQLASSTPAPTPMPVRVPAKYDLDAVFDYRQHTLSVMEIITYVNLASDTLNDLILIVEPNLMPNGLIITAVTWQNGENITGYALSENLMQIPLAQPLQPGQELNINLEYRLNLPELNDVYTRMRPISYGYSARQTNIVDWYAYVPPYVNGQGWLVHPAWDFGEYQVFDEADFYVRLTLTEPVPNLVIAASAPATQEGLQYYYHLQTARTFALSASTEYTVQTAMVGDVTVFSYSFPLDKLASQEVLSDTVDAIRLYSQLLVPYPHASLSIVEADFLDGMEFEGLFFLSHGFYDLYDGTPKGYLTFIAAHETAHQWWYALVGNDQALEPWLDEALCTYMEHIFLENIYPDYPAVSEGSIVDWWWYYRVNFYDPEGWVNSPIYDYINARPYRDAVYLNGAKFLDDLRNLIGDRAFFASLQEYATRYAHKIATAADFIGIVKEHTSQDLSTLLSTYFQPGQ